MKKALFSLGLIIAAATGAGAIVYYQGWLGKSLTPQDASRIIPQEASLTGFINTDPQVWSKLGQFGTLDAQKFLNSSLDNLQKQAAQNNQISYQQDIEPWLGNIMWAVIPNSNSTTPNQSNLLLIVGIKNKLSANNLAKKLENQAGYQTQKTDYQGITIVEVTNSTSNTKFSWALLDSNIILSDDQTIIQRAIDVHKGQPSYAQKPSVQEVLKQKINQQNPLAQVYFVTDSISATSSILPPATLQQLGKIKSFVVGIGVVKQGLHITALTRTDTSLAQPWLKSLSNKTLSQVPENTMVFFNSQGIKYFWDLFVTESSKTPESMELVTAIRQGAQQISLDADKDIFSWMDGEVAVGLLPSSPNMLGNLGLVMLWQTSDPKTAKNTLEKLNSIVATRGPITVQQNNTQGKDVTQWQMATIPQPLLSYTWLESNSLAVTIGMPLDTVINTQSQTSLNNNTTFQNLTSTLPKQNLGYGYIDVEQLRPTITPFIQSTTNMSPEALSVYESIEGIAMTSSLPETTLNQSDVIIGFKSLNQKP